MRGHVRIATLIVCALAAASWTAAPQELKTLRERAFSDDARNAGEATAHGIARANVIRSLEPNKLGVGGATFRVKRNPTGAGCFVYEPQTRFAGVERKFVWWVNDDGVAYAVNGASKGLTPRLEFPPQTALQPANQIVAYVFEGVSLPPMPSATPPTSKASFTVKEYHAYRLLIDMASVSEEQAAVRIGRCLNMTPKEVASAAQKVQNILSQNNWFGRAPDEIRHATDWKNEVAVPKC
jgi:predicted DNA-binding protein (UPF0251 family)